MCRNIRTLHNFAPPATEDEIHAAALQYVRKISGFNKPSRANEEAFARAVDAVTEATSTPVPSWPGVLLALWAGTGKGCVARTSAVWRL